MARISVARMRALRAVYALNFVGLGFLAWSSILNPREPWGLMEGAAVSFWAALALLMGVGIRYPLKMLPLLVLQLSYKLVWLGGVAFPLWSAGLWSSASTRFALNFVIPIILDVVVIPWGYVRTEFATKSSEQSLATSASAADTVAARSAESAV